MFTFFKLHLLCHFIVISVTICASRNIDTGLESDPRIFFYLKDFLNVYSKGRLLQWPLIRDTGVLRSNQSSILSLEYYAEENILFCTTSNGELLSTFWNGDENKVKNSVKKQEGDLNDDISSVAVNLWPFDNQTLYSEKDWYPISMALDDVGKKLYIADSSERSIDVFDLDGKNKARIFISDYLIPYEIAIDSDEGLLFLYGINFLKRKTELHRMNTDGSDRRVIIDTIENLTEVTLRLKANLIIDRENKQLYYKASSNNVATVDYNGEGGSLILSNQNVEYFGIYKNNLIWTTRNAKKDAYQDIEKFVIDLDLFAWPYPLWSCKLNNQIRNNSSNLCGPIVEYTSMAKDRRMNSLKIFDFIPRKKPANPCLESNNGCEDHCLLKSSRSAKKLSFSCACRLGRKINNDGKTCSDIKEEKIDEDSIPYVYENVLLLYKSPAEKSTEDGTDEFSIHQISSNFAKKFLHDDSLFVWDDALNDVYKVDEDGLLVRYQNEKLKRTLRYPGEDMYLSRVLAYDWVSKNLYYARGRNNSDKYNLYAIALTSIDDSNLYGIPGKERLLAQINKPTSMAIDPYRGYLFIATIDDSKESHIIRLNTDGKDELVFPYSNNTDIMLALDMAEGKIYWSDGCVEYYYRDTNQTLWSSNLDGSDAKLLMNRKFPKRMAISVYGENIYLKELGSIQGQFYVLKKSGEEYGEFSLYVLEPALNNVIMTKQKVKKTDTQYLSSKNPCVRDNGGCEYFCFAVPAKKSENLQKVCSHYKS